MVVVVGVVVVVDHSDRLLLVSLPRAQSSLPPSPSSSSHGRLPAASITESPHQKKGATLNVDSCVVVFVVVQASLERTSVRPAVRTLASNSGSGD